MKKVLIILILAFYPLIVHAENEFISQELLENTQENEVTLIEEDENLSDDMSEDFKVLEEIGKDDMPSTKEQTPIQKVLSAEIVRTDVLSFLLKDELTFTYNKGPVAETQFFGGYRGALKGVLPETGNFTKTYENNVTEFGVFGKTRNPNYDFKVAFRPIPVEGMSYMDNFLCDIYLVNTFIPHHKIIAGYQRVQTGIEGGTAAYLLPFYSRSQIARNFGNARAIQAKVVGNYEYADYSISVGSSGRQIVRGMPGAEFTGWFNAKPFGSSDSKYGRLTIGAGLNTGHHDIDYSVGSVYVGYKHKKLWSNFEAGIADGYSGATTLSSKKASGYAFTAGWKFTPKFQLIGRVDNFDPNRDVSGNNKREYTAGVNWFIKGQALKFILNYVYCQNQNARDSHKFVVATQVMI